MQACRLFSPTSFCCFSLFYCISRQASFVGTNIKNIILFIKRIEVEETGIL
jgi:hypothetical protein